MKYKLAIIAVSGFIFGILFASFINLGILFGVFCFSLGVVLYFFYKIYGNRAVFLFSAVIAVSFSLGIVRFYLSSSPTGFVDGEMSIFRGVISAEPDLRDNHDRFIIDRNDSGERVLVISRKYPQFFYGDEVEISGKMERPRNFLNENGKEFDYISYLAKEGIGQIVSFPDIKLIGHDRGSSIISALLEFKGAVVKNLNKSHPSEHASLLAGLLVGAKQSLGKELLENFRRAGLVHLVVLSGYNITIIANAIILALSFLPFFVRLGVGSFAIVMFTLMTGAGTATVRAAIMALIAIFARLTGRIYDATAALIFSAVLMVVVNPKILVFDISFQLSFAATAGLIYLSPIVGRWFLFLPERFSIREMVVSTLSAQVAVLPLLLYKMGDLSLVAPIVNLLVIGFVPISMFLGAVVGLGGFVSLGLVAPFAYLNFVILDYIIKVTNFFAGLPFAVIAFRGFSFLALLIFYVALIFSILILSDRSSTKKEKPPIV